MQLANQRVPDSSDGWIERGAMHANAAGQPVEGAADEPAVSVDQISWCCRTAGPAGDRSGRPGPGCWDLGVETQRGFSLLHFPMSIFGIVRVTSSVGPNVARPELLNIFIVFFFC
jgi:hypothetical protein